MFKSVRRAVVQGVEKTWHTFASHGEGRGDQQWDSETNRYKREILIAAKDLAVGTDTETMCEAIKKIGHLAYCGGPDAARCAGTFLETLVGMLMERETPMPVRTQVVQSLSEIYRGHRDHTKQFRTLGVISIIADIIRMYNDSALLRWCCYTLFTVCAGSLRNVALVEAEELKENFSVLAQLSWKGWPRNYAQGLLLIIGYAQEEDFEGAGADDGDAEDTSSYPMALQAIFRKGRRTGETSFFKRNSVLS
ncbi:armadillo-like helical domain-containing protein 2 [Diadema setosum]|uniref:armadillo-like helical domain-containing protein 2 n=1 Tax=Diadema setosum TaxID=31175 RepID=UPI003B3A2059